MPDTGVDRDLKASFMIRKLLLGIFVFSSAALCDGITRIVLPSGDSGYSVTCEGSQNVNKCYEMAGEVCIYGYTVVDKESEHVTVSRMNRHERVDSVTYQKGLLIQCKRDAEIEGAKKARADSLAAVKAEEDAVAMEGLKKHWFLYSLLVVVIVAVAWVAS